MSVLFDELCPDKAQYASGEPIGVIVRLRISNDSSAPVRLEVTVTDLGFVVEVARHELVLAPSSLQELHLDLSPRMVGHRGYGVDARLFVDGLLQSESSTSFDVVDSLKRHPRYGFCADFNASDESDVADVECLRQLHLPFAQFYDWMYRHDTLLPPAERFIDPMGKPKSMRAVRAKIDACHARGIRAIAYGAVYAATADFYRGHTEWGLADGKGRQICFIDRFFIMDIGERSPWRKHIVEQFHDALSRGGFDGIHMDTYGFPKTGRSVPASENRVARLEEDVPSFIQAVRDRVSEGAADAFLLFNNVGNWPVEATARAALDGVYVEVWPPYERYGHLREIIQQARALSGGKPVILAAYCLPFKDVAPEGRAAALASLLLLQAVIAAHGALHLVYGGESGGPDTGLLPRPHAAERPGVSTGARLRGLCHPLCRASLRSGAP